MFSRFTLPFLFAALGGERLPARGQRADADADDGRATPKDDDIGPMALLGLDGDGFYEHERRRQAAASRRAGGGAYEGAQPATPKPEHPLSGQRTQAVAKGPGKPTRAQRRAANARKVTAAPRGAGGK